MRFIVLPFTSFVSAIELESSERTMPFAFLELQNKNTSFWPYFYPTAITLSFSIYFSLIKSLLLSQIPWFDKSGGWTDLRRAKLDFIFLKVTRFIAVSLFKLSISSRICKKFGELLKFKAKSLADVVINDMLLKWLTNLIILLGWLDFIVLR